MDDKYIVYWWNYGDQDPYKHGYDSLTEAIKFYNHLVKDEEVGRISVRWGNTEIQGMITEQYLKESEG